MTLAGLKAISISFLLFYSQFNILSTSTSFTLKLSQFLMDCSRRILIEKGKYLTRSSFNALREKYLYDYSPIVSSLTIFSKGFTVFDYEDESIILKFKNNYSINLIFISLIFFYLFPSKTNPDVIYYLKNVILIIVFILHKWDNAEIVKIARLLKLNRMLFSIHKFLRY